MMLRALLICALAVCGNSQAHVAEDVSDAAGAQQLADVLFPETHEWRSINSFPHPAMPELDSLLGPMIAKLPRDFARDVSCSITERLIRTPDFIAELHQGDIFGPGDDDFVYVGENPCAEGDITIVWRHVREPSRMISLAIRTRVLRVDEPSGVRFSEVEAGCCAEVTDHYRISDLSQVHQRAVGIFKGLTIPAGSQPTSGNVDFGMWQSTELYMSPAEAAHPETATKDEDGEVMSFTVHGGGKLLMTYHDSTGKLWSLVEVGGKFANAGWVSGQASRKPDRGTE
jgi:hypothetical protein